MVDATNAEIIKEFKRQVYLCSGMGESQMAAIVRIQFDNGHTYICDKCRNVGSFLNGHICPVPDGVTVVHDDQAKP